MSAVPEADTTICDIVRRHALHTPDAPALVAEGKAPLTYKKLECLLDEIQQTLYGMGYGREDRIAIVGPNDAALAVLILGIWGCAAAVPMNPALSVGEFAIYLRDVKAQALAILAEMATPARAAAEQIGLPIIEVNLDDGPAVGRVRIQSDGCGRMPTRSERAQFDDLALVTTTSGTTSHSKVVPFTHREFIRKAEPLIRAFELTSKDRCLNLMPLFHAHGLIGSLGTALYTGGSLITLPEFSTDGFFRLLGELSPTWYTGSYTFHHAICAAASDHMAEVKKSKLRFFRTASGHLDPRIADELEKIFRAPIVQTYSNTEVGNICTTPLPPAVRKPGTVGIATGNAVEIMGADDQLLAPGGRGEIVVNAAGRFSGYENDPAANAAAFTDGWFRTGDEGVFDEDGYLTLTGRIKDIINRGGEKITPSEVDDALKDHPDVANAVTFPLAHATLGQEVAAAVVPEKGAALTDEILTRHLKGKLAAFKLPRRIVIVDEIPTGPTGKVERGRLAEAFGLVKQNILAESKRAHGGPATPLELELQAVWADVLGLDSVGLDDDFFLLGGDSLQAVDLFLRIEKELGRRLPRSVLFEAGTVAKMAERIAEAGPSPCLVPIQPKGDNPPFFCVHDGNGEVLNYRDLAELMGATQPFYGIQCRGLDREGVPFTRIEDMAAYYISEIKTVQPEGPYYIGGYSFGGRVAYVMAQELSANGEEVALLALLDTASGYGQRRVSWTEWFAHHRERLKVLPKEQWPAYLWLRATNLAGMVGRGMRIRFFSMAWNYLERTNWTVPRFMRHPVPANDMIRRTYQAKPYDGDATLFKAERYAWSHADAHEGWKKLVTGRLEVRPISGRHFEIVDPPHVQTLAAELIDALQKARAAHLSSMNVKETVL